MTKQTNETGTDTTSAGTQPRRALTRGRKVGTGEKSGAGAPRQTKRAQLIALLKRKGGTDIAALSKTLGWQAHTVRAALTGLRKAEFGIERIAVAGGSPSRYRITTEPSAATAG